MIHNSKEVKTARVVDIDEAIGRELDPPPKRNYFILFGFLWVAAAALNNFSYFSSAMEYHHILGRIDMASTRVLGMQAAVVGFFMLSVVCVGLLKANSWPARIGLLLASVVCFGMGSVQSLDSFATSYGYLNKKVGEVTGDERIAEATLDGYEVRLRDQAVNQTSERARLDLEVELAREELASLDLTLAPAIAAGTKLKPSYSINRKSLSEDVKELTRMRQALAAAHLTARRQLQGEQTSLKVDLQSSNVTGTSNSAQLLGVRTKWISVFRTASGELALIVLAVISAVTMLTALGARTKGQRNVAYCKLAVQLLGTALVFGNAHRQFVNEVNAGGGNGVVQPKIASATVRIDHNAPPEYRLDVVPRKPSSTIKGYGNPQKGAEPSNDLFRHAFNESQGARPKVVLYD